MYIYDNMSLNFCKIKHIDNYADLIKTCIFCSVEFSEIGTLVEVMRNNL